MKNYKISAFIVAGAIFASSIGLNLHSAYAQTKTTLFYEIDKVVTFVEYKYDGNNVTVDMKVPVFENTGNKELEERLNNEIKARLEALIANGEEKAKEYKEAFFATGGKASDFHKVPIYADYDIKYFDENILSFILNTLVSIGNASSDTIFYNIDLETGEQLKLSDVLGKDFKKIADESINRQIKEQNESNPNGPLYFNGENGVEGFKGVDDNQTFFINENGDVVIKFARYEIAPGFMGKPEFVIAPMNLQKNDRRN